MDNIETMDIKTIAKMAGLKYNSVFKYLQKNKVEPTGYSTGKRNKKISIYDYASLPACIHKAIELEAERKNAGGDAEYEELERKDIKEANHFDGDETENLFDEANAREFEELMNEIPADDLMPNPCVKYLTSDLIGWFVQLYGEETTKTILANDYGIGI